MAFEPHNMREIADKIQTFIEEAEKAGASPDIEPDRQSLDDLLTDPAGAAKLGKEIDKNALANKLKLDTNESNELSSAIENLSKDSPVINQENALAILSAFKKIAPTASVSEDVMLEEVILNEKYNKNFDDPISFKYVENAIKDASEISPMSKDLALQLAITLKNGSKNRKLDEGLEGILNAVMYLIEIAKSGNRSELLHMLDDFETKYEGDRYAFDQSHWTALMKNMRSLGREILSNQK